MGDLAGFCDYLFLLSCLILFYITKQTLTPTLSLHERLKLFPLPRERVRVREIFSEI
jgi:hypothetical protein